MFFTNGYYYYLIIGLQAFCAFHCIRRGTQQKWIWLIVFLPVIGSLIYIYSEIFTGNRINKVQSGVGAIVNPGGQIKKLETNLKISDTFSNRVTLADAYMQSKMYDKAIDLYESSLSGNFRDNEEVLSSLVIAYYYKERYNDILPLIGKINKSPSFSQSKANLCYIVSLEKNGQNDLAENEFKKIQGRFSNFEARYEYGMFLLRAGRKEEAQDVLSLILEEVPHLSQVEKRHYGLWLSKTREAVRSL
jgi:hypothetical protein